MWDHRPTGYQCVALRDVKIAVRLGVYPHEHEAPQTVSVDVELYRAQGTFAGGSLADCLDYDRIFHHLTEVWPARTHTELLEVLAEDAVRFCLEDPRVEACRVLIRKLEIYSGRAVPELSVYRRREP